MKKWLKTQYGMLYLFFGVTLFCFRENEEDPLLMGNERFPPKMEGEGGAFLGHYDILFL